jgi:hypothetical protein
MPKAAIANGFFIGEAPHSLLCLSRTELAMINLSIPQVYLSVVRGGKNMVLRSHAYFFKSEPGPVASMLPQNVIKLGSIKVSIIGALTSPQKAKIARQFEARPNNLRDAFNWLKHYNHFYSKTILAMDEEIDHLCLLMNKHSLEYSLEIL